MRQKTEEISIEEDLDKLKHGKSIDVYSNLLGKFAEDPTEDNLFRVYNVGVRFSQLDIIQTIERTYKIIWSIPFRFIKYSENLIGILEHVVEGNSTSIEERKYFHGHIRFMRDRIELIEKILESGKPDEFGIEFIYEYGILEKINKYYAELIEKYEPNLTSSQRIRLLQRSHKANVRKNKRKRNNRQQNIQHILK